MSKSFGADLHRSTKIDNHHGAKSAKVAIRRHVLEAIQPARVFDAFAGAGEMFNAVWREAADYVGCDQKQWFRDERTTFVCDNRRVLRCIDLRPFNVFDLDSYGAPWEQAIIIAARRPVGKGERIGFALTEGSGLKLKMAGAVPLGLAEITGVRRGIGLARWQTDLYNVAVTNLAQRMSCEIVDRWEAKGRTGALVHYIGLVMVGR